MKVKIKATAYHLLTGSDGSAEYELEAENSVPGSDLLSNFTIGRCTHYVYISSRVNVMMV